MDLLVMIIIRSGISGQDARFIFSLPDLILVLFPLLQSVSVWPP